MKRKKCIFSVDMKANERLQHAIRTRNSLVCVGLDVTLDKMPKHLLKERDPVLRFNRAIIEATADLVAAYKPNLAFYEALGAEGWTLLRKTLECIPEGIIRIGDAKRGDIGSTARKYAEALFGMGFDYVTVNPYMGSDSVSPFLEDEEKGIFLLCLTSNPGSRDFQYLDTGGKPLFQRIAEKAAAWNKAGNCGLVAGATHPEELGQIRTIAPELPLLIPGIGAQGGDLEASVLQGTDRQGTLAVINSSRGIIFASQGEDFAQAARSQAELLRDDINRVRAAKIRRLGT